MIRKLLTENVVNPTTHIPVPAEGVGKELLELWKAARDNEQTALDLLLLRQ